eukprot:CAMPEP_0178445716 /NCGR_PEP_ID=MMETSP0689_2-20121128/40344_1 /TAXON_ID=160604 /ORGANISM="Amphidinium massartii, Strain CS-259" /LENGTH=343 /DNA_ID=CAMNT_0020070343 /DNA_START=28 /DNA_END=1059 /DNA_ORIENTATION=-
MAGVSQEESSGVDRPGFVQLPFRIGLISDIQYADSDIGSDYSGQERRYYRDALDIARRAVECWNAADVDAVVQLGDVIDGKNGWVGASASSSVALARVLGVLDQCTAKDRLDLIGNHELYNFPRSELATCGLRCVDKAGKTYYSRSFGSRFEAIVLDPYEHALIGMKDTDAGHKAAVDILSKKNPQALQEGANWFKGVPHADLRYVPFNGGMSAEQLAWLSTALEEAEAAHRTVLVFSHVPVYEAATNARTLVWDADKVMELLHRHRQSVLAVVSGHDHDGGYAVDDTGIHHITLRSPLITEPGSDCFAVLECFPDGTAHFVSHGFACPGLDDMVLSRKTTMA